MKSASFQPRCVLTFLLAITIVSAGHSAGARARTIRTTADARAQILALKFAPLKFQPRKAQRLQLENGLTLFVLEDHELPLLNISARIRAGSYYEPADKAGLSDMAATVLRRGGTVTRTPDEVNRELELVAAAIEVGGDREFHSASMTCLMKDANRVLELFADIMTQPTFREEQFNLTKQQTLEEIRRRNDEPGEIARREFRTALYGMNHPFGWRPELETVQRITRDELITFHRNFYKPSNCWMAITGDFEAEELISRVRTAFANWQRGEVNFPQVAAVEVKFEKSVHLAMKDINQSNVRLGHFGVKRNNPDQFALTVMNEILGGSGISRIWRDVRSRRGLAYSVFTFIQDPIDVGMIGAGLQTKAETTIQATNAVIDHIKKMRAAPPTEEELKAAKESIVNLYVFRFQSAHQIAAQQMALEFEGYPADYLETYVPNIQKVTRQDVHRVAQKYLRPDALTMLVVGDPKTFDKPADTLGQVREVKLEP